MQPHSSPLAGGPIRRVFLAPETKRFLRGAVGIAEQDAFALGHNVIGRPRRHHEDIVRFEGKIVFADLRSPGGPPLPLAPPCNRQRPFFVAGDRLC